MDAFQIETTQNVEISYTLAGIGDRVIASLIDLAIQIGYVFVSSLLVSFFSGALSDQTILVLIWSLFVILPFMLYDFILEVMMNGQTPGKSVMKIQVVMLDGSQPSIGSYLLRAMMRFVDVTLTTGLAGLITILVSEHRQRLGDHVAGTAVVRVEDEVRLSDTLYKKVAENYLIQYPSAKHLTSDDIDMVRKVSRVIKKHGTNAHSRDIARKAQSILSTKMDVTVTEESPEVFLTKVVKDYNAIHKN